MKLKRTAAAVVAAVMAFTAVATPLGDNIPALEEAFSAGAYYSVKDNFYPVALTGDGAVDMVNVAVAQNGRKDDDTGWYPSSEAWCADFVMDVARVAGQTGAVPVAPANAACGTFKNALLNAGAQMVTTAQAGDIVFYCGKYNGTTYHVGIMKDSRYAVEGNAYVDGIYKVHANRDTRVFYAGDGNSIAGGQIYTVFIRPNYTNNTDKEAPNLTSLGEEDWNRNGMGFFIKANATDNVGVTKIAFTVSANGRTKDYQANLEKNNTYGWQYISVSDFSNFLGTYSISCAAYDACGNKSNVRSMTVTLDKGTAPTVADKTIKEGTYCLRNGVGLNMDVRDGTDNKENRVIFHPHNGSDAQLMKFIYKGNGKYLISPKCSSTGKVIDVYRPTNGNMNIDWGDKIDLYPNDDDEAQEFYVVPVGNGDYVLELASKDNFVIGGKHTYNDADFYLQPYLNFAPSQRFRFTDASGNAVDVCNHSYKETRTEPTCTAGGKLTKVCKYCGKKVEETINAPGHSWSGWSTTTYPTCTAQGVEQRTCSRCSKAETRYITALGHNYSSEWTIDKQATCSAEGSKSKHCTRCSSVTEVTAIPKTAHSYKTTVVAPTLTSQGYTVHECTVCHYSYKDSYTSQITLPAVTGVKVKTQGSTSLTLAWDKNASANGYVVEQYKGGKWTQITKTASNAVVSYTVNGLKADTLYTFRIKGYVVSGTTEYSGEYTRLAVKTRIANVGSFKGSTVSDSAVKLDWSKNDKATGYVIEQYKGGKWTALATTKNNTTLTFTVKGLASATVYSFRIKSFRKAGGKIEYSEYASLKAATSFGGVNSLTVKSYTASAITLAWSKNAGATGYALEQYKGGKWTQIAKTSSNATVTYTVNGLKADTTYTFRVRAYKTAAGKTIYSEYARLAAKTRIAKVATFTGSAVSASEVKLDWSKNDKATGYVIEQYKGGKWTALATTKNNTTLTFTVKGLAKGTTYSFRIKAFRKTGSTTEFSEYSSLKAATRK